MKKKLLPMAMLCGLSGAAGRKMRDPLNPDKQLLYPYYSDAQNLAAHLKLQQQTHCSLTVSDFKNLRRRHTQ